MGGREGPLWLPDALVTFWCVTETTAPVNDQVLVVGRGVRGSLHEVGKPLLRWHRGFRTDKAIVADGCASLVLEGVGLIQDGHALSPFWGRLL
ncbi:flavin reductase [Aestuariimicrobium sp. Y1814]|uniref:flavin reductase n=1 Tax=Aestuariimicrobium sp. Y1814 TaxID=3418742 RepID=UPI003DA6FB56